MGVLVTVSCARASSGRAGAHRHRTRGPPVTATTANAPEVDARRELGAPRRRRLVWLVLAVLIALEAGRETFGLPGPATVYETWIHVIVLVVVAALLLARAAYEREERAAWRALAIGMICWCAGTVLWDVLYNGRAQPPFPTPADALWLLWYPFTALGIGLLIRSRVGGFELARWIDGVALMLLALAAALPLTLADVGHQQGTFATIVDVSYPVLDTLVLGSILGVLGLLAWRLDRFWIVFGVGCLVMSIADAAFAVEQARGVATTDQLGFAWALGAVLVAYSAWLPVTPPTTPEEPVGWGAIALPLAAALVAATLQAGSLVFDTWDTTTHRAVVLVVLAIAVIQIVASRPRPSDQP